LFFIAYNALLTHISPVFVLGITVVKMVCCLGILGALGHHLTINNSYKVSRFNGEAINLARIPRDRGYTIRLEIYCQLWLTVSQCRFQFPSVAKWARCNTTNGVAIHKLPIVFAARSLGFIHACTQECQLQPVYCLNLCDDSCL
jgi:hypothetical protein